MTKPDIVFYVFDDLNRLIETVTLKKDISSCLICKRNCELDEEICLKKFTTTFEVDGYFLSKFIELLNISSVYYRMVVNNFLNNNRSTSDGEIKIKFELIKPKSEVLDYVWNDKICNLLVERQELEHAMSWLSTLGGAFSALGDSFENCAKEAGKISIQQFKIAFRLGEPPLVARCRLYMALSLIQLDCKICVRESGQNCSIFTSKKKLIIRKI